MDASTVAIVVGAGVTAVGMTAFALWPIAKKVREVVPAPPAQGPAPAQPQGLPQPTFPGYPILRCGACEALEHRVEGLEERERASLERERVAHGFLMQIAGRLSGTTGAPDPHKLGG